MNAAGRIVLVTALLLASSSYGQTELTGQTPGGAYYRIAVPEGWTPAGGLVIWNHGFSLAPVGPSPGLGPLAEVQLSQGYAVAASSYALPGWALFTTARDNRELVQVFEAEVGVPGQVLVYGASLGGIVTAQAIESHGLGNVVGAYSLCGAVAGSRNWDGGFDLRLVYDAVCGDVPGGAIPGGATGLPPTPDPELDDEALAMALTVCTGLLLPPPLRSVEQQERLDTILEVTSVPELFLLTDMTFATFGLADLIYDPAKLDGGAAFSNRDVDYGDAAVNATIQRVDADDAARRRLLDNFSPTGRVGDVRIVSLHTDKDGLVVVENASAYASVVSSKNLTAGVVVESIPTHCGFTEAEAVAGWEALRGWVAGAPQPTVANLQETCEALASGGLALGPCRIDPDFVLPSFEDRIPPRGGACSADDVTLCLNEGRFSARIAWEDFKGRTGVGHSAFRTDDTGAFWFFDPDNVEMMVKVLDGRPINGRFWVFYGSLTNVRFELTVTDTHSGLVKIYTNPSGNFASLGDTSAF